MLKRSDFPDGFLFGAATAAYQIEGSKFGGAGPCHWDTFAATPGNVVGAEDGAVACDHFHRFEEDLDLLKDGGFDAYRFSTSWARVLPEGRGQVNEAGLDFYDRLVDACLERGLKPFHTVYHWEMPAALSDLGGWTHPDVADWLADFAEIICGRIGDRTASTASINEPWCVSWLSHFIGHHAPGLRDIRAGARSLHHVLKAHGAVVERLRGMGMQNLGIVLNFDDSHPATDSAADRQAQGRHDALLNRWFIGAVSGKGYPAEALEGVEAHLPTGWEADLERISAPIDWLGVNYYTRALLAEGDGPWPAVKGVEGPLPKNQMGWEIHPDGLHRVLTRLRDDYVGDLPIIVTENGMPWDDKVENGAVHDPVRQDFIAGHLDAMHRAIADGVNLQGFFYWSLLDNYEWAFGYGPRFGMVHVDYDSLKRTPKGSYHALAAALAR